MNNKKSDNLKTLLILIPLVSITEKISLIPWWTFIIPVIALGAVLSFKKWMISSLGVGFLAGALVWMGACLIHGNNILDKVSLLFSLPKPIVVLLFGIIGGSLSGLALHTGKSIHF